MASDAVSRPAPVAEAVTPELLLDRLTDDQRRAVGSPARRVLVVAGAGSGKTEVMARRVAWWVGVQGVEKSAIVAFTFTEKAAEEMKFRIRHHMQRVADDDHDATLGDMYVGTIHGFCMKTLREVAPDRYHNYDVVDEGARIALVQRTFHAVLGLASLRAELGAGKPYPPSQSDTIDEFLYAYDMLNEYDELDVRMPPGPLPSMQQEAEWCKQAVMKTAVGTSATAKAFAKSAARFYAYMHSRHFLDFSTTQSELTRFLRSDGAVLAALRERITHLVVDEVQDLNPVQNALVDLMVGDVGHMTAVGDHRQAIFGWRGGRVDMMAGLYEDVKASASGEIVELPANFRSTPRIIEVANAWARSIGDVRSMSSPDMTHGRLKREDFHATHVAAVSFETRDEEAEWIANTISTLVRDDGKGARIDTIDGMRGIGLTDVAVLLRSSTDARTYMEALEANGIPAVVRAGPDLFAQPEVLLFVAVLAKCAGIGDFFGANWGRSLKVIIPEVLGCDPNVDDTISAACDVLRDHGLPLEDDVEKRLMLAGQVMHSQLEGEEPPPRAKLSVLRTPDLVEALMARRAPRRLFPQRLYHQLLAEAGVGAWEEAAIPRARVAMFHLGQLSSLITGIETPGWVTARDFKYQVSALYLWGARNARSDEAPMMVAPEAVTISTIHAAKGLEFPAVFVADVNPSRFPSGFAKRVRPLPFTGGLAKRIDATLIADNDNLDDERRLMYVAMTRAEQYLFITRSGGKSSRFAKELADILPAAGATVTDSSKTVPRSVKYAATAFERDSRLVTTFSDLRYYLECPHDFFLRKVLGFSPTIDQAFGYGRGVHNIMRVIHTDPAKWATLANDRAKLVAELQTLVDRGLMYLRYTTGDPEANMKHKAVTIVADYVQTYAAELERLTFEPERAFETLLEEEATLISGAMDVIRLDDPPRVTIIDFKSGEPDSDLSMKLDEDEMRLQVSIYGLAAKQELEYEPDRGLVRYLDVAPEDEHRELSVDLGGAAVTEARAVVAKAAAAIRERTFDVGPTKGPRDDKHTTRCQECDFAHFCGRPEARAARAGAS